MLAGEGTVVRVEEGRLVRVGPVVEVFAGFDCIVGDEAKMVDVAVGFVGRDASIDGVTILATLVEVTVP